jgi:hypothetical protein
MHPKHQQVGTIAALFAGCCMRFDFLQTQGTMLHACGLVVLAGPTGPAGTGVAPNATFVVGASSTVNANTGSVVFVNDGAQFVDNRTTNTTFSLLGAQYTCLGALVSCMWLRRTYTSTMIAASCTSPYTRCTTP